MNKRILIKIDWVIALALGVLAAILFFGSCASYAFPGESAHLQAIWRGLDFATNPEYPLTAFFAKALGGGNLLAPLVGTLASVLVYLLVAATIRLRITDEQAQECAGSIGAIAGSAATLVFLSTPAVQSAATHLEPRLFDVFWLLLASSLFLPYAFAPRALALLLVPLQGVLAAVGFCDTVVFAAFAPFALFTLARIDFTLDRKPYAALGMFTAAFIIAFFIARSAFGLDFGEFVRTSWKELGASYTTPGWIFAALFATLPFFLSLISGGRSYRDTPTPSQWAYHIALSICVVLAFATPLSPSALMERYGQPYVLACFFVASVAGQLVSFWWYFRKSPAGKGGLVIFALVLFFAGLLNVFTFDADRGAFADKLAGQIIDDMGKRSWFVSDGTLDDHVRLVAADRGVDLTVVSLSRDLDEKYLDRLSDVVRAKKVGGSKAEQLALSLKLGVLPFVQDWFRCDRTVAEEVAIFSAPDLWYSAGFRSVPEFAFFGADESKVPDPQAWKRFDEILAAPKNWGSYRLHRMEDPLSRLRLSLRRHLGLVANNRGVYLLENKRDDEAFQVFETVLNEVDRDNVSALFNEVEMSSAKHPKAAAKQRDLERRVKEIVDDKDRRYVVWRLGSYYGYIRNPDMFIRLGFAWAKSGRAGEALAQIRRAFDFVPKDRQQGLMNMMASLYATENDKTQSRRIYSAVLDKDAHDHDALIGMMRLELMDGDAKKALEYLERAAATSPAEGNRAKVEYAMVSMMKGDLVKSKELLRQVTDANPKDLQSWSLLASVTMQQWDAAKDETAKAAFQKELSDRILPMMEKQSTNPYDYYIQTTKAFLMLRQGEARRREARDAFAAALKARPDAAATQDMLLGLDISLDDKANAEQHARSVLRLNRDAPLANYVMGSLAIGKGRYDEAEGFLRKAVAGEKPNILALNDLAETLRRLKKYGEAERTARKAVEQASKFYIVWETLGVVILESGGDLAEAERCVRKAIELSTEGSKRAEDVRLFTSLARIQQKKGDVKGAKQSVRKVQARVGELSDFERKEFEEIKKGVR